MASSNGGVPPGFRFHPTDEELLHYYLKKKVTFEKFEMEVIKEVDLNKIEPWDLQERCGIGSTPQNEWYFFSHKDRKYPTGSRTNRATNAGFWKATGRDKCIRNTFKKIGMRKTLVFYRGRAPHGQKTDWIMHEYRLEDSDHDTDQTNLSEEGWVVCRVFKKKNLFKVGSHEVVGGSNISQDQNLNMNTSNLNKIPHTTLINHPTLYQTTTQHSFDLYNSRDLSLNYSHLSAPMLTYNINAHNHAIQAQNFIPRLDCADDQDQQNLNEEWGMFVASTQHQNSCPSPKEVRFEDVNASSSIQPMSHQLTLRGETDFWGYGK